MNFTQLEEEYTFKRYAFADNAIEIESFEKPAATLTRN